MFPICAVFLVFYGDTYAGLANHLVHEVHSNNISLYGGDSHNTNSFVHCAGEVAEHLQEGNYYVALSQEKSEEIWRKRTRGSGGDGLGGGGHLRCVAEPGGGISKSSGLDKSGTSGCSFVLGFG